MNESELERLLADVRSGTIDQRDAARQIVQALRAAPFEDLGFARLDTHREVRQGFPEVILGVGKTPAQIALIAERIVARGQALLVTRAMPDAYAAVRAVVPAAIYHGDARAITLAQGTIPQGRGTVVIAC